MANDSFYGYKIANGHFIYVSDGNEYHLRWKEHNGLIENCAVFDKPIHSRLVLQLLKEAGYKQIHPKKTLEV